MLVNPNNHAMHGGPATARRTSRRTPPDSELVVDQLHSSLEALCAAAAQH